ncbi:predicted protein [Postia placenta Mad-698-R]|nr:predicted protein [Postia placenta Mad-698-R]
MDLADMRPPSPSPMYLMPIRRDVSPSVRSSLSRASSMLSVSSYNSTAPLILPPPATSPPQPATPVAGPLRRLLSFARDSIHGHHISLKEPLKRLVSSVSQYVSATIRQLSHWALIFCGWTVASCAIGLIWVISSGYVGWFLMSKEEPYKSAGTGYFAAGAAGGAILGVAAGYVVACLLLVIEWSSTVFLTIVGFIVFAVGISGQALGVFVLQGKVSGMVDMAHAVGASVAGSAFVLFGVFAIVGACTRESQ